ncbi:MAG TPA: L,D-transpeptidase family protein [Myxococcota bacterium]|nr:L,D-transpeptidase family protein [Myxococcota bacterium]
MKATRIGVGLLLAAALPLASWAATVEERVAQYGAAARARMLPSFEAAGVPYPPQRVVLVGLKVERRLDLYAAGRAGPFRYVRSYPIHAASGGIGPKLRAGDEQVPEGLYRVSALNPNSQFHLSLRIDYPNVDDRRRAEAEGRTNLGGDIMIHGRSASTGCLAMGDPAAEDLFVLAAETGIDDVHVVLSPLDFRRGALSELHEPARPWVATLYDEIRSALAELPHPPRRR